MKFLRQNFAYLSRRKTAFGYARSNAGALATVRDFHASRRTENAFLYGGLAVLSGAALFQYGYDFYVKRKAISANTAASEASETPPTEGDNANADTNADTDTDAGFSTKASEEPVESAADDVTGEGERREKKDHATAQPSWLDQWFAKRFYDGGFEEKMTKREAALVLGVRESSAPSRVKKAHRRILLLNHPDMGGSPFIAAKVNEAKDLLLKGRE